MTSARPLRWLAGSALSSLLACAPAAMPASVSHPLSGARAPRFDEASTTSHDVRVPPDSGARVAVIDFWASWCSACEQTIPSLDALFRDKQAEGVMVIGVSLDEKRERAIAMAHRLGTTFPIVLDPKQRIASQYRVGQIPLTFVVDQKGSIRWIGRDPHEARRAVDAVLEER